MSEWSFILTPWMFVPLITAVSLYLLNLTFNDNFMIFIVVTKNWIITFLFLLQLLFIGFDEAFYYWIKKQPQRLWNCRFKELDIISQIRYLFTSNLLFLVLDFIFLIFVIQPTDFIQISPIVLLVLCSKNFSGPGSNPR